MMLFVSKKFSKELVRKLGPIMERNLEELFEGIGRISAERTAR